MAFALTNIQLNQSENGAWRDIEHLPGSWCGNSYHQVTLPEGITLERALAILADQEELQQTLNGPGDARIVELVAPHNSPEGLFFPDSYQFERGASDWDVLLRAHRRLAAAALFSGRCARRRPAGACDGGHRHCHPRSRAEAGACG